MSKQALLLALTVYLSATTQPAWTDVTFEWVTIGHPGNNSDPQNNRKHPGIGSVGYLYRMAKSEVTNEQYAECLNAVAASDTHEMFRTQMQTEPQGGMTRSGSPGSYAYAVKENMGNKPVNFVSFFDAMRFINWLHNGQPSGAQDDGSTEDGVYAILDGTSEVRAEVARFFIPTDNEWYKAAYHQPATENGDGDDYWLYPTGSNIEPTIASANEFGDISNPGPNVVNYSAGADWNGQDGNVTTVGSAGEQSSNYYGLHDQGGNVWEWTETVNFSSHIVRGGGWFNALDSMWSSTRRNNSPGNSAAQIGFRVASPVACDYMDADDDGDIDLLDFAAWQNCMTGAGN